jgi:hypothetical protein
MSSAELTVWARIENLDRQAMRALWEDRSLVKTWAMRGTLHLLPARELSPWHAALATNRRYLRAAPWQKYYGLTIEDLERLTEAVATALSGRVMTKEQLVAEVGRLTGSTAFGAKIAQSGWGTVLKPAAFTGRLCFGPASGQRARFTHPETWVPEPPQPVAPETATVEVARRYLAAYGPATYHDLARWWNGGGIATARQWIGALGGEVFPVEIEGARAWMLAADAREIRDVALTRSVRLLPGFDQYVVAASCHAAHLLPRDFRSRVYRPQGWISPVLLVNGRMEGTWNHEIKGNCVDVVIQPFVQAPPWVRRAAAKEAERLAAFFGRRLSLSWKI